MKHPKLVNDDLEKLMAGVPETAMLRMGLSQLASYGYPEFSEIAAGSNVGVAILTASAADLKAKSTVTVGFAKLKDGGKLATLIGQMGLATQKQGDWVLIAKTAADLAKLKSPDAVIAYLEKPQTADLRLWGRASPEVVSGLRDTMDTNLKAKLSDLSAEDQKAALGYADAIFGLLAQLHSAEASLTFTDDRVQLSEAVQFQPDTPIGIFLRYAPTPAPAVAQYVSSNALGSFIVRQNPNAVRDLSNTVFDSLIAVDYPSVSDRLKDLKAKFAAVSEANDGGGVVVFDLPSASENSGPAPSPEMFYVLPGRYTPEATRPYLESAQALSKQLVGQILPKLLPVSAAGSVATTYTYAENALTVDGVAFDAVNISSAVKGKEVSHQTQYIGIIDGNLVVAGGRSELDRRLPALLAKTPLADGVRLPDGSPDSVWGAVNGGPLVEQLAVAAKLDLTDADTKAQIDRLKADYAAGGPIAIDAVIGQAKAEGTLSIPYKFIATSVHFGQYLSARKINFQSFMTGAGRPGPSSSAGSANP